MKVGDYTVNGLEIVLAQMLHNLRNSKSDAIRKWIAAVESNATPGDVSLIYERGFTDGFQVGTTTGANELGKVINEMPAWLRAEVLKYFERIMHNTPEQKPEAN